MNNRKLTLRSFVLCAALTLVSCAPLKGVGLGGAVPGSGNVRADTRSAGPFQDISLEYPADVTIQQGEEDSVVVEADDNLLQQLSSEVTAGRLTIKTIETDWKAQVNPSQPVKITITVRNPRQIEFSAPTGTLEANGLHAGALRLALSGAGQVKLNGIQVDFLDTILSGAGDIQVAGVAKEVQLVLSGAGNFNGTDLKSDRATVQISGMGDAILRVESQLAATITGAGSVNYFGDPRVEQSISGAGSVKPAE